MYQLLKLFLGVLMISSCSTYHTFYSNTYQDIKADKKVYRLDLSERKTTIDLTKFKDLRVLNLSDTHQYNDLEKVLEGIPNPELLEVLVLNNNNLVNLPGVLTRFKNLKQLSLHYNPELDYPQVFKTLSLLSIEFLDLQFNQLTKLDSGVGELKSLEELNVSNNRLDTQSVFNSLSSLSKLRSLWLRNNKLSILSKQIHKLGHLVNLYAEHNNLKELPLLSGLTSLRVLHLSFNKFETFPLALKTAPSLILLHIDHCNIRKIPLSFNKKQSSFKGLIINNNKLSETDKVYWKSVFKGFFLLIF